MIYGKDFDDCKVIEIAQLKDNMENVVIQGQILSFEVHNLRAGKTAIYLYVADNTGSIKLCIYSYTKEVDNLTKNFKKEVLLKQWELCRRVNLIMN